MTDRNPDIVCSYCLTYLHSISAAAPRDSKVWKDLAKNHFCDAKCREAYKANRNEPKGGAMTPTPTPQRPDARS